MINLRISEVYVYNNVRSVCVYSCKIVYDANITNLSEAWTPSRRLDMKYAVT